MWHSTVLILIAFVIAGLVVWFGPMILGPLGLGEFVFVGQICFVILALSVLEAVFGRLSPPEH
jgi:hypothetical protein